MTVPVPENVAGPKKESQKTLVKYPAANQKSRLNDK
jgi:hypothetical protein